MPCFPVVDSELAEAQAALGIALPASWTARLRDPGVRPVLAHPRVRALDAAASMARFVALTFELRELDPQFPRDGVVCFCATDDRGRYLLTRGFPRFWRPDRKDPGRLGDMLFSWDPHRHKAIRDCPGDEMLDNFIASAPDDVLAAAGLVRPAQAELPPLVRWQPLADAQARLAAADAPADWIGEGTMAVSGTWLAVCDLARDPSQGRPPAVKVVPGTYAIELRYARSARSAQTVVAGLRLRLANAAVAMREPLGSVDVDLGGVSIHDRQAFQKQVPTYERDGACEALMDHPGLPCVGTLGRSAQVVLAPSGNGDGVYPVFALHDATAAIGIEVDFAAAGDD